MTNNEKINAMSVEEKAKLFQALSIRNDNKCCYCIRGINGTICDYDCVNGIALGLNSEVKDNG